MFETLQTLMLTYAFLSARRNPVLVDGRNSSEVLSYSLTQYANFPRTIVLMLLSFRDLARQYGWAEVAVELTRNIGEELGTETNGVTHYALLVQALAEECGLDVEDAQKSNATAKFISNIFSSLLSGDRFSALGSVYALEATARPELLVVVKIITNLRKSHGHPNPGKFSATAQNFFDLHVNIWEPGHSEGLRLAAEPLLTTSEASASFETGFRSVLTIMETWWQELADEASRIGQMSH